MWSWSSGTAESQPGEMPSVPVANGDSVDKHTDAEGTSSEETTAPKWDPEGIEDFSLTERSGRTITKDDLLGHPWAVGFIFTRCAGPCPKVSTQMRKLQDALEGTEVRLVSISVDPEYDTPERLRRYAEAYGADPERWLFLTGDRKEIYRLIIDSFRMPVAEQPGTDQVLHSTNILHVDSEGRVVAKYNALVDSDMAALQRALLENAKAAEAEETPAGETPSDRRPVRAPTVSEED